MRELLQLSRADLALLLSVRVAEINDIENGKSCNNIIAGKYKSMLKNKIKKYTKDLLNNNDNKEDVKES